LEKCEDVQVWPGGHQQTLGYHTRSAPKGKNYLFVEAPNHIAINILDMLDPNFIPFECIELGINYSKEQLDKGFKILIACNSGHSRGPTTGLCFLRAIGDMPHNFATSERIYRTLYRKYDPGMGMRQVARSHWAELNNQLGDK
jgi:hypothetical protein